MTRWCAVAKSVKVKESKLRFLEEMEKRMLLERYELKRLRGRRVYITRTWLRVVMPFVSL